jgi:hypothetical protein
MKKIVALFLIALGFLLVLSCNNVLGDSSTNPIDPVDPAFWFGEIHDALINSSLGNVTVDDDGIISRSLTEDEMGQIANCQYVCNAINAKWQTSYVPVSGTATQAANCEYLLKMIDNANRNTTNFGTGGYATKQVVDKIAVDTAVQKLWVPGSKFVAVSSNSSFNSNIAAYSTNGINWTAATLPSSAYWQSVTYGNGRFVAVAYYSNKAAYSTDGINWTAATLPSSAYWYGVTYGNDKFVAVANGRNIAAYSTDGINWAAATLPSSTGWQSVTYGEL